MAANRWLRDQRKSDLVELAEWVGMEGLDGLKKSQLELEMAAYLSANADDFANVPELAGFYSSAATTAAAATAGSRAHARGSPSSLVKGSSPIKRDPYPEPTTRASRRRATTTPLEEFDLASTGHANDEKVRMPASPVASPSAVAARPPSTGGDGEAAEGADVIDLPASPSEVAAVVETGTLALHGYVAQMWQRPRISELPDRVRATVSTVGSVLVAVTSYELYNIRKELIQDRYLCTIPAVPQLGMTSSRHLYVPDLFMLAHSSFWSPAFVWAMTSFILPSLAGYFINLSRARRLAVAGGSGGSGGSRVDYNAIDPLVFSVAKAILAYMVFAERLTFGGLLLPESIGRLEGSLHGGWKGVLVGCAVTGVMSMYDAILQ